MRRSSVRILSIVLLAVSLSAFFTSYFIIGYVQLASIFAGWILVSLVLYIFSSTYRYVTNPESIINSYRHLVRQVLEEFNLMDVSPIFLPSSLSGVASMFVPSRDILGNPLSRVPKRLFVLGDVPGVRVETLGSYLIGELGGVGDGLSSAESFIKSILTVYLEIARGIELSESGGVFVARITGIDKRLIVGDPPAINIFVQVVGPILSEALDRVLRLSDLVIRGGEIVIRFSSFGG